MALSTVDDYKTALYKIISLQGPNHYEWVRVAGIADDDATQIESEYQTWFLAQPDRIHEAHQTTAH